MKVIGTRVIKEKSPGNHGKKNKPKPVYQLKELEAIVNSWIKGRNNAA
jgi:hypothetical protein